ncbi:N-acetylglucosaminyl-phosphatidylinositol de-N-acetylase [Serendipita sp. 399]|nr:N-acetylglucosaminyl-phosphatidylinositol de-N-acetylase [Serendipita sp. 399]
MVPRPRVQSFLLILIIAIIAYIFQEDERAIVSPDERFLLLTAHPDDECLFFGPTVVALSSQTEALFSLTVSNGNNDGIGLSREPELRSSLAILGIPSDRSFLLNHPRLQDNFTDTWDVRVIAEAISPYIISEKISTYLLASAPKGIRRLRAYALVTDPLLLKYSGWATLLSKLKRRRISSVRDAASSGLPTLQYWSGLSSYVIALRAMYQHRSQLVWFRWLYVLSSRYMWHNKWVEIEPAVGAR